MTTIRFRRGTDAAASANNPVLAAGEPGWTDEGTFKIGDGTTAWNDLEQVGSGTYVSWEDVTKHGATGDGSTDDTTAVQAAVDAVEAAGGGVVWFPLGTYLVSGLAVDADGVLLLGASRTATVLRSNSGDVVTLDGGVSFFGCQQMRLRSGAGGGHIFHLTGNLIHGSFRDLRLLQENDAKAALYGDDTEWASGTLNYIDNLWDQIEVTHTSTATVATFQLRGGAVNRNRWTSIRPTNSGEFAWLIETTAASSYANDNTIEGVTGEVVNGGLFKGLGVAGTRLADIGIYDLGTTTNDLIEFGTAATGSIPPTKNLLDNVRRHGGTLGSGLHDLQAGSSGGRLTLVNCGGTTAFDADFNSRSVVVVGGSVTSANDSKTSYVNVEGQETTYLPPQGGRTFADHPTVDVGPFDVIEQRSTAYFGGTRRSSVPALNDSIGYSMLLRAGTYRLDWYGLEVSSGGVVTASVDGTDVGTIDTYAGSTAASSDSITGITVATGGLIEVTFTVTGQNASSSGHRFYHSAVSLTRTGA